MRFIDRATMKENAKASLKGRWGLAIGVMLLYIVIDLIINAIVQLPFGDTLRLYYYYGMQGIPYTPSVGAMSGLFLFSLLGYIVISPIVIGYVSVYLKISRGEDCTVGVLFSQIRNFLKTAGLLLLMWVKVFLWSLLFVIPGIIAALRYSMAPYIMAENPDIGINEAIERSKDMMRGNKWRLFVLYLSFIGWALLIPITFGIILFWLNPYMSVTYANFYNSLLLEQAPPVSAGDEKDSYTDDNEWRL